MCSACGRPGQNDPVRVELRGRSGRDVVRNFSTEVGIGQYPITVVDHANGMATFPVRNQGLNVIGATYVGSSDQPAVYEKIEHLATLSFVLPHLPE